MPRPIERDILPPQTRLRRQHEQLILRAITAGELVSRAQLAADHDMSAQSVGRIVRDLLAEGLVEETSSHRRKGPGAPRVGLRIRPNGAYAFGFGIERDRLDGVLLDAAGTVCWQQSTAISPSQSAIGVLRRIEHYVHTVPTTQRHTNLPLCGLGIAVPGPVNVATGTIVGPPNFPHWQHVDVAAEFAKSIDVPVVIDNAATAAAIGTKRQLRRGRTPFFYCYWGVGIGGALVIDDEAYHGMTGNTMEMGHIVVAPNGRRCHCGRTGCLEAEASVAAILREAAKHGEFSTIDAVVAAGDNSQPLADILTAAAEKMAIALINVANLVDVDEIIIGGEHFRPVEHIFLPILKRHLASLAFRRKISTIQVTTNTADAANAIGAAALAFHTLLPYGPTGTANRQSASGRPVRSMS